MEPIGSNIDVHLGKRVRILRKIRGLSQEKLANTCGVRFQQVQKYECGANRIGAARLLLLSEGLEVTPSSFFTDLPGHIECGFVYRREEQAKIWPNKKLSSSERAAAVEKRIREIDNHIGECLKHQRRILHMTPEEFATLCEISVDQVRICERGRSITAVVLWQISKSVKLPIDIFYAELPFSHIYLDSTLASPRDLSVPVLSNPNVQAENTVLPEQSDEGKQDSATPRDMDSAASVESIMPTVPYRIQPQPPLIKGTVRVFILG